jgi:hypothetical protein
MRVSPLSSLSPLFSPCALILLHSLSFSLLLSPSSLPSQASKDKRFASNFMVKAFFLNTNEVNSTLNEKTGLEESVMEKSEVEKSEVEEESLPISEVWWEEREEGRGRRGREGREGGREVTDSRNRKKYLGSDPGPSGYPRL